MLKSKRFYLNKMEKLIKIKYILLINFLIISYLMIFYFTLKKTFFLK